MTDEQLQGSFAGLKEHFDKRLDGVEKRFDAVDARFDGIEKRFDVIDTRCDAIDRSLGVLERRMGAIEERLPVVVRSIFDSIDAFEARMVSEFRKLSIATGDGSLV
jgi:hypothetical protein